MKANPKKQKLQIPFFISANIMRSHLRKVFLYSGLFLVLISFNSCNKFLENLSTKSKDVGSNLVEGLTDHLATDSTKLKIDAIIGNISRTLTDSLNKERLSKIGVDTLSEIIGKKVMEGVGKGLNDANLLSQIDSFLIKVSKDGKVVIDDLFEGFTGTENKNKLTQFLADVIKGSLDDQLDYRLRSLTRGLLDSVITDLRIEQLKSQLIGQNTGDSLNARLDSAISIIINRINKDLEPIVEEEELSFLKAWGNQLLILGGLITLGLIAFFWYQKNKSNRITQLLMTQINEMPNQKAYDDLTHRIQQVARNQNVETVIRGILKNNGMLGEDAWNAKLKKQQNNK